MSTPAHGRPQLAKLAARIDRAFIRNTRDGGKGEDYAPHHAVNQLLLLIVGPFSFELVQIHRGDVLERSEGKFIQGKSAVKLSNVVVGATFRLTATVDGERALIEQTGDVEHPDLWQHDGARLKDAESDALKRCAMRLGLGLHLWADPDGYILDRWLPVDESKKSGGEVAGPATAATPASGGRGTSTPDTPQHDEPKQQRSTRARSSSKKQESPAEPADPSPAAAQEAPAAVPPPEATAGATTTAAAPAANGHPADQAQTMEQLAAALGRSLTNCWLRLRRAGQNNDLPVKPFAELADANAVKQLAGEDLELARAWLIDTDRGAAA